MLEKIGTISGKRILLLSISVILVLLLLTNGASLGKEAGIPWDDPQTVIWERGLALESVHLAILSPALLVIGPNDEILVRSDRVNIHQITRNGEVSVYTSFPEFWSPEHQSYGIEFFAFDPSGRMWLTLNSWRLLLVNESGEAQDPWGEEVHIVPYFAINSQGVLYAAQGEIVQRITPDGEIQTIVEGGIGEIANVAIGPNDEVLVTENTRGELIQVFDDGSWSVITDGLSLGADVSVAPYGTAYVVDSYFIASVDLETGVMDSLDWLDPRLGGWGEFDSAGDLYLRNLNNPAIRIDIADQRAEVFFHPKGNSWAMTVGPESKVYVAYGDRLPGGTTTLYRLDEGDVLTEIATLPYRHGCAMAFGPDGTGYLAVGGPSGADYGAPEYWDGWIYTFDCTTGEVAQYQETSGMAGTLAVDPTTGDVWWTDALNIHYRDALSGQIHEVPDPVPADAYECHLTFDEAGVLYAHTRELGDDNLEWLHRLYKREDDTWSLLFTATGPTMSFDVFTVCPDGGKYGLGKAPAPPSLPNRSGPLYSVWRIKDDGTFQLLATDTGVDPQCASCDPLTGDLYYTYNKGIARFYWWAMHFVHLPLVLKDFGP